MSAEAQRNRDEEILKQAARAALRGRGFVEPNPTVGAIVASGGDILGRGCHADYGGPHAERTALQRAGERARGATLYVTLEPCSSHGKTPPCTDAVIAARIRRVVVGALDPDARHQGRGLDLLRAAGIQADHLPVPDCEALLTRFRSLLRRRRPYTILKWAMTLDGRIAARDGSSKWISGEGSRRTVQRLRGHADAVMVGSKTVLTDDPTLTCRIKNAPLVPARVVVDPFLETPDNARMIRAAAAGTGPVGPVWILCAEAAAPGARATAGRAQALVRAGAEVIPLSCSGLDRSVFLGQALDALWERGVRRLLVEGGGQLFTAFVESDLADQVVAFVAPKIVGDREALCPVHGRGAGSISEARDLREVTVARSGADAMIVGFF